MSYAAALKGRENGVDHVYNLEGGHSAWLTLKKETAQV
jgi:rhodanese-related sulfurtransferase